MHLLGNALLHLDSIVRERLNGDIAIFLDYDGTLTPIVNNPEKAILSDETREVLRQLSDVYLVGIVSGRSCDKLDNFLQLSHLTMAGSHGLEIRFRQSEELEHHQHMVHPVGTAARAALERAQQKLDDELRDVPG